MPKAASAAILALAVGGVLTLLGAVPAQAAVAASFAIDGAGEVGTTLTLRTVSPWDPAPDSVTYTWHRFDNGMTVHTGTDAAGTQFTPTASLVGTQLYVEASAFVGGSLTAVGSSSSSATIHLHSFSGVPAASVPVCTVIPLSKRCQV